MRISEIYESIQGEGKLTGMPSTFIRTTGCNLRCTWCDTPYTSWEAEEGEPLSVEQIFKRVRRYTARHVVLTGGEPLIELDVAGLTRALKEAGFHVTIETAGTVWQPVVCDLASISPKLANSTPWERAGGNWADAHERNRINLDTIRRLMNAPDYQLKFVVDRPEDIEEIDSILERLNSYERSNVLLMPQGVTEQELNERSSWLVGLCKQRGFRYCPRLHISLFGLTRGT